MVSFVNRGRFYQATGDVVMHKHYVNRGG